MRLKISLQPPPYAFFDDWFTLEVICEGNDEVDKTKFSNCQIHMDANLHFYDGGISGDAWNSAVLTIDPGTKAFLLSDIYRSSFTVRLKIVPDRLGDRSSLFCIKLFVSDEKNNAYDHVAPVTTSPIHLVSSKLVLEADEWESIWYKDEGGRDKCMQVVASLCDKNNNLIFNRKLPLTLTLLYDNEFSQEVMKQSNLKIMGASKVFIDPDSGQVSLRFRIEDVSKNHQGQNFKILVASECFKYGDVAPATTPPVAVRSKRNKRGRSTAESPLRRRITPGYAQQSIRPALTHVSSVDHTLVNDDTSTRKGFRGTRDTDQLREAMKGIIRWTEEVVHGLHPLQWQVIGYAQYPDGTIDYNHPYYNMPNPNSSVSKILQMYSESVRDDFKVLLNAVERTVTEDEHAKIASQSNDEAFDSLNGIPLGQLGLQQLKQTAEQVRRHPIQSHIQEQGDSTPDQTPTTVSRSFGSGESTVDYHHSKGNDLRNIAPFVGVESLTPNEGCLSNRLLAPKPCSPVNHPALLDKTNDTQPSTDIVTNGFENDTTNRNLESQIFYVLSKQYKSVKTGDRLGHPVFSKDQTLLGFYRNDDDEHSPEYLVPITILEDEFGPRELKQASHILDNALKDKSSEVHALDNYRSTFEMLNSVIERSWHDGSFNTEQNCSDPKTSIP